MSWSLNLIVSAAAVLAVIPAMRVLPVRRNPLFYFLFVQVLVYCFLAPTYTVYCDSLSGSELGDWYLYLQCVCLFLFLPAFLISYAAVCSIFRRKVKSVKVAPRSDLLAACTLFSLISSLVYLAALAHYGLLFRRIGHGALATEYLNLPAFLFLAIRIYDRLVFSLVVVNLLAYLHSKNSLDKRLSLMGFVATLGTLVVTCALNSRSQLIITFALVACVFVAHHAQTVKRAAFQIPWRMASVAVFLFFALSFSANFREQWNGSISNTLIASLSLNKGAASEDSLRSIAARLDGIDLMARMGPDLTRLGYSNGSSWYPSVVATVGFLWDPDRAREIKADLATSPKYYLMYDYAGINLPDYPSCMLTDAFGNFGVPGIVAAAVVLGACCAMAMLLILNPPSVLWLVVGITALQNASLFEAAMLSYLVLGWIQNAPALIAVYFLCPLRIVRMPMTSSHFFRPVRNSAHALF